MWPDKSPEAAPCPLQVVVTPLYQAPSVTGASAATSTGAALWQHLTTSFGYLSKEVSSLLTMMGTQQVVWRLAGQAILLNGVHMCYDRGPEGAETWMWLQGFCPSATACKTFAVVLGGFGSPMTSPVDMEAFADLASYLQPLCGLPACLAADGAHSSIFSWFWEGWSPDSAGEHDASCLSQLAPAPRGVTLPLLLHAIYWLPRP